MRKAFISAIAVGVVFSASAPAQRLISARAGFVNYKHGDVRLPNGPDGKPLRQIAEGQSVATGHGRLELLLMPGAFLRLDHESEVRMASTRLDSVRVELLSGTATIEVNEIPKGSSLSVIWREQTVPIVRSGLYRFEASPESVRIYVEQGKLELAGMKGSLKSGKYIDLAGAGTLSAASKFNRKDLDAFDRWNRVRGEELALASVSAAQSLMSRGLRSSVWYGDPYRGFFTYVPSSFAVRSPFGYTYHCPRPTNYGYGDNNGGNYGGGRSSGGGGVAGAGSGGGAGSAGGGSGAGGGSTGRGVGDGAAGGHDSKTGGVSREPVGP